MSNTQYCLDFDFDVKPTPRSAGWETGGAVGRPFYFNVDNQVL
jgi:hypothetical protein